MANHRKKIEQYERILGETVEAISVGRHDSDLCSPDRRPEHQRGCLLSREDGLKLLNIDYNAGYGGAECFPFYAWTANYILLVQEYDGATDVTAIPRNPVDCEPQFL